MESKTIVQALTSQYKASLGMLRDTIQKVPDGLWNNDEHPNPIWQLAYHVLWGMKFYLGASPEKYVPWANAIEGAESLGGAADWENPEPGVVVEGIHTQDELLAFIDDLELGLEEAIAALALDGDSGFEWYPYSRLELHVNSIRHIQHHTAQIIERLKLKGTTGFPWRVDGRPPGQW